MIIHGEGDARGGGGVGAGVGGIQLYISCWMFYVQDNNWEGGKSDNSC